MSSSTETSAAASATEPAAAAQPPRARPSSEGVLLGVLRPIAALLLLFVFLVGVQSLSTGIKALGSGALDSFMTAVQNPFLGLVTGILATTLVQSSSVTTSLVVGMVASGTLPIASAVPMVMGANIGTTVTNTLAALAQIGQKREFRRAFAAATVHDFFNYLAVLVLLPLEIATGFLEKLSGAVNGWLPGAAAGVAYKSPIKVALKNSVKVIDGGVSTIFTDSTAHAVALIVVSIVLIFFALTFIVKVMKSLMIGRLERFMRRVLSRGRMGKINAIGIGAGVTVAVQSSSITTSIMVPMAGAGLLRLYQVFPVTVGANIGTTVTALLASMAVSGEGAAVARQIALVHLLFNVVAMLILYVPRPIRKWPMHAAQRLAKLAVENKVLAMAYVVGMFYGIPALLVFLFR